MQQGFAAGVTTTPNPSYVAVKLPVFSWSKLAGVDTSLGPEMKSTGEVMGIGPTFAEALAKGFAACGVSMPRPGQRALCMVADRDKAEALPLMRRLHELGMALVATSGTHHLLEAHGIPSSECAKLDEGTPNVLDLVRSGQIDLVVNTLTRGRKAERDGFQVRRAAAELGVACLTSLDTLAALLTAVEGGVDASSSTWALQEYALHRPGDVYANTERTLGG